MWEIKMGSLGFFLTLLRVAKNVAALEECVKA